MLTEADILTLYRNIRRKKIVASFLIFILLSTLLYMSIILEKKTAINNNITNLPYYGLVVDFTLMNTNNESYNLFQDQGKIRLVNFFYTKCPGDQGCSLLTLKLSQVFAKVRQNELLDKIRFISIDFDYINDTIQDLSEYANRYTADTENWQFLFGNKTEIDQVTNDWGFYFELTANITSTLTLNHHPGEGFDPYEHTFVVYIIDENNNIRQFLLGNSWQIDEAWKSLSFLVDNGESETPK
ncbi:MAG: SCO family protein [Candidatus Heimdallarchaeota archaeon]|nr:SCO family protein [Candidatus Heimdallarchaeota archaeon]